MFEVGSFWWYVREGLGLVTIIGIIMLICFFI